CATIAAAKRHGHRLSLWATRIQCARNVAAYRVLARVEGDRQYRFRLRVIRLPGPCCQALSNNGVLSSRFSDALDASATCCKARSNVGGKSLPRFSARRRMPLQAVALKKY